MSTTLKLVQGSPEWLAHRLKYRNASETPAVMGLSPWVSPYLLWLERTGRAQVQVNAAMTRGSELEPVARAAYEKLTGHVMEPLVMVDGEYSASLDGITLEGDLVLEIKCPMKGRASQLWQAAEAKELPENYFWQVQHQLMVAGAALAHVYVFDGTEGVLVEQAPQPERWEAIRRDWDTFMRNIAEDTAPPLCDRDTRERNDEAWRAAAEAYLRAKQQAEHGAAAAEVAKAALVALTSHPSESGSGVSVVQFWKKGAVDYRKVPQLKGVNLEPYRKELRMEVRVTAE
jgi:putative phage-type endonuclease